jgi:hypothetical protein
MPAFELPYSIKVTNPVPVDYLSGPYIASDVSSAKALANSGITHSLRFKSLEVRLIVAGSSKKYWYQDGIEDTDLVEFVSGDGFATSSFYIQGGTSSAFDTTSDIYRTGSLNLGIGTATNGRFVVSSLTGSTSLVVDDDGSVYNLSKGITNSAFGYQSLQNNTTGTDNSSFGFQSLQNNTTGSQNTSIGRGTLRYNTTGSQNTAFGYQALNANGTGISTFTLSNPGSGFTQSTIYSNVQLSYISGSTASFYPRVNIVVGTGGTVSSVTLVTTGTGFIDNTTVMGTNLGGSGTTFSISVLTISTGINNTAIGSLALANNTIGYSNVAVGRIALYLNTTGYLNTAVGQQSLYNNTTGIYNNAFGYGSLQNNISGSFNTSLGLQALLYNTTGSYSTALGHLTLRDSTTVVSSLGTFSGGSGYVTGTYSDILLTYSSGSTAITYPTATIVVGVGGTISSVTLSTTSRGVGFKDTTTIMSVATASVGGTGSGFTVRVSTLDAGSFNTALGHQALMTNRTGSSNISIGFNSMNTNSTGSQNVAIGGNALFFNTTGGANTAIGFNSSYNNTTGTNTALGYQSLYWNTTGTNNTALGYQSLYNNTTGTSSLAIGHQSLYNNTTGQQNTALGQEALRVNTTGSYNTAVGTFALLSAQSDFSTALGREAGRYSSNAILVESTGSLFLGYNSKSFGTSSTNEIVIGATAVGNGSNTVTLGNDNITKTILKGNVGIGLTGPSTKLHVYATQSGAFRLEDGTQGNNYILKSDSNGVASWTPLSSVGISGSASYIPKFTGTSSLGNSRFKDNGTTGSYEISTNNGVYFLSGANTYLTLDRGQSAMFFYLGNGQISQSSKITSTNTFGLDIESVGYTSFNTGSTYSEKVRITSAGNVGIGLTAPSTKLHIFGTQSGAFRLEDGTQSYPGYVLTSDENGVGTWQGNTQITLSGPTATALATWNNTTVMSNFSATCSITIPDTGLPPNFSFRFIIISGNNSATITFATASLSQILPNTLLTFAQYESGVIDRYGTTQNYYITY